MNFSITCIASYSYQVNGPAAGLAAMGAANTAAANAAAQRKGVDAELVQDLAAR